jgi:hypothetical protein
MAQGVPAHVGTSSSGVAGEQTDPYASFLPSVNAVGPEGNDESLRAVVFVAEGTPKGTARSAQEYLVPLLVLSGREYAAVSFAELHTSPDEVISVWTRKHTKLDAMKLVGDTGIPAGAVLDTDELNKDRPPCSASTRTKC